MKKKVYKISAGICLMLASVLTANSASAQIISTIVGDGTSTTSGDGGPATAASVTWAASVTRDAAGNTYIVDDHRIRKIDASSNISTIAGSASYGFSGDGGPASAAVLNIGADNSDIITDNAGNIYFPDVYNSRIRKISISGVISTIAGTGTNAHGGDGGAATAADLYRPNGLAFDAAGNLFISDNLNHVIRKINMATGVISTVAGTPSSAGYSGDGGAATAAQLRNPVAITFDAAGNMYIAEYHNNVVRKVAITTGIISTIAGDGTSGSIGDGGAATAARLYNPNSISFDLAGNLFIADLHNHAIRKVNTAGVITTVAGTVGTASYTGDGGAATAATLNTITDFFLAGNGDMYLADLNNKRIRLITAADIAFTGSTATCVSNTSTLTPSAPDGAWVSSNTAVATVSSTGIVSGISTGTTTISYAMGLGSGAAVVTVNPAPVPVISAAGSTLSVTATFAAYQWLLAGAPISGAAGATYAALVDGSYAVTITEAGGCQGTSVAIALSGVGVNDVHSVSGTAGIFPNPAANGLFTISLPSGISEAMTIVVTSLTGEKVYEGVCDQHQSATVQLNVPAGMYLVHIVTAHNNYTSKVIVK